MKMKSVKFKKLLAKVIIILLAGSFMFEGTGWTGAGITNVSAAVSKTVKKNRAKAEKSLIKAYNDLVEKKPYSEENFKKLRSLRDEGAKKINSAKKKKDIDSVRKKYVNEFKKIKDLLEETGKNICVGYNAVVGWKPVAKAVKYKATHNFWVGYPLVVLQETIVETHTKISIGEQVYVDAYDSKGERIDYLSTDGYYKIDEFKLSNGYLNAAPVVDESKLLTWNAFEKIDTKSLKKNKDGSVSFETKGPNGEKIRFWGEDVDIKSNSVTIHKHGRVMMTDGIGRIYSMLPIVENPRYAGMLCVYGGFNIDYDMHPGTIKNMIYTAGKSRYDYDFRIDSGALSFAVTEPNFAGVGVLPPSYDLNKQKYDPLTDDIIINQFIIKYTPSKKCTRFRDLVLAADKYGAYLVGEKYDKSKEVYEPYDGKSFFTLYAIPDLENDLNEIPVEVLKNTDTYGLSVSASDGNFFKIGDLKDKNGKKLNKDNAVIKKGDTISVQLGKASFDVALETVDTYEGAKTFNDLLPYAFPSGTGKRNVLVIPIIWEDEQDRDNDKILEEYKSELGRAAMLGGKIKDHSAGIKDDRFSLSEYFDIASYGKMTANSYITDWYNAPYPFADKKEKSIDWKFICEVVDWLYTRYPDTDFSQFDLDSNGYFDQVILLNSGDMSNETEFFPDSFGGAVQYRHTYGNEYAGTTNKPAINNVVNMNASHFKDNTLIHEFSHGFGLIDYYDVSYSGINAVGGYDMQSDSMGDWNAYSKYAAGWINPKVVTGLKPGESVEFEIGALAEKGDAIVIPAASDTLKPPFSEYMLVDLYTSSGVNKYDSVKYGINDFTGVRIYHVDARMEKRDFKNVEFHDMEPCTIGTIHIANNYKESEQFNIELIQAGAKNTFTNHDLVEKYALRSYIMKEDFFQTGDVFTMEKYSEFFKDGLMDTGAEFGYKIEIVSVSGIGANAKAVIRITRK